MHMQVAVFEVERQRNAFARDRRVQRRRRVQVDRVAELILLRGAAGLDSGSEMPSVMPTKARLPQRSE